MNIFKLFFSFDGKIHRVPFILVHVVYWLIAVIMVGTYSGPTSVAVDTTMTNIPNLQVFMSVTGFVSLAVFVVILYSTICVYIKRFRDTGFSPWLTLLILVPVVNLITFIFLIFYPPKSG